jgi:hypothetical protein
MLGTAKKFTGAWFAIEAANWGGQAVLLTAEALHAARELQAQDVHALGEMYKELQSLGPADASSDRSRALQVEITERAHAVSHRIGETFTDMAGQNVLVAVAGSFVHSTTATGKEALVAKMAERGATLPVATVHAGGETVGHASASEGSGGGEHVTSSTATKQSEQATPITTSEPATAAAKSNAENPAAVSRDETSRTESNRNATGSAQAAPVSAPATMKAVHGQRLAELRQGLPAELHDIPIVENPALHGKDAQVRYRDGDAVIEVGPTAGARQVQYHAHVAVQLRKYRGPLGFARRLLSRIRSAITGHPAFGTEGFEARFEVRKLREIIADVERLQGKLEHGMQLIEHGSEVSSADLDAESELAQQQLEYYKRRVDSHAEGVGAVAAKSRAAHVPDIMAALEKHGISAAELESLRGTYGDEVVHAMDMIVGSDKTRTKSSLEIVRLAERVGSHRAVDHPGFAKELIDAVASGRLDNAISLKKLQEKAIIELSLPEPLFGTLNVVKEAIASVHQGKEMGLEGRKINARDPLSGRGDLINYTDRQVTQNKVVTGGPDKVLVRAKEALVQLTGATGEIPPAGFEKIVRIVLEGKQPWKGMQRDELMSAFREAIVHSGEPIVIPEDIRFVMVNDKSGNSGFVVTSMDLAPQ